MTPDQRDKLLHLEQRLLDVFQAEADPDTWPGMATKDDRGDRYWYKKNAMATIALATKIQVAVSWVDHLGERLPLRSDDEGVADPLDTELALMEEEATKMLSKYRKPNGKRK